MSISRLPGWYGGPARWPSANTARRTRRSAGIRRIWPSQWCLRVRTAVSRSYEGLVASSRYDLPVMLFMASEPGYERVIVLGQMGSNLTSFMERSRSVVECQTCNQVSLGSNPPLLPFRRLGIFVLSIDAPVDSAV